MTLLLKNVITKNEKFDFLKSLGLPCKDRESIKNYIYREWYKSASLKPW